MFKDLENAMRQLRLEFLWLDETDRETLLADLEALLDKMEARLGEEKNR